MRENNFLSVARHWTWADCMRRQFGVALTRFKGQDLVDFYRSPEVGYMFVWYALLFAVCEELRERHVKIPEVQPEIDGIYGVLKRCRNAVDHVQGEYWSRKLMDFVKRDDTAEATHRIHDGIGQWIRDEMLRRGLAPVGDLA